MSYLNDHGKLLILLTALIGAIALRMVDAIDATVFTGVVGHIVGYVTGNGVLAKKGEAPSPLIARPPDVDHDGPT